MSFINDNDSEKFSNIFDSEENIKNSPQLDDFHFFKDEKEESQLSFLISDESRPLFINNENFINYFMHIDYNTPFPKEKINSSESHSNSPPKKSNISNNIIKDNNLLKKTKRNDKDFGIITDNLTGITYYEEEDPINFRKAKKRIQNRESAQRMKKLRENNNIKIDEEINRLKEDNIRLINENVSLKKEKMFLIDQIKFMQKIIKESNLEFKLKNTKILDNNPSVDTDSCTTEIKVKEPVLYYNGSKQKIKGKLFNVFCVCILSIFYITGECYYDGEKANDYNRSGTNEHSIHLNSIKENKDIKNSIWYYFSKIILIVIFFFIIPWFKAIFGKILGLFDKKKRKKYL